LFCLNPDCAIKNHDFHNSPALKGPNNPTLGIALRRIAGKYQFQTLTINNSPFLPSTNPIRQGTGKPIYSPILSYKLV
jgi:hypothetical protein